MSDVITPSVETKIESKQVNDVQQVETTNKDLIKSLIKEETETIRKFYNEEIDKIKAIKDNEIKGLNRSVSEREKIIKEYKSKELTDKEKFELERKEFQDEWLAILRLKAINKFDLNDEENDFTDYLNIDTSSLDILDNSSKQELENGMMQKAEKLKKYIENKIKKGIEKGVEARLSQGYTPKAGLTPKAISNYSNFNKEQLTDAYKNAKDKIEKDEIWKIMLEKQFK
jgi:hypothetical protein